MFWVVIHNFKKNVVFDNGDIWSLSFFGTILSVVLVNFSQYLPVYNDTNRY